MTRRLAAAITLLVALAFGCARARDHEVTRPTPDGGVAIDTEVMAYLSMARALHHEANLKEDDDVSGAVAALERLTTASRPHPGERVPEVEEVLADTYARLAELEMRRGNPSKGGLRVREGLLHAPTPSYFRGHLLEVGGIAEEARAAELRDAGRAGEATAARAKALDLLHQAVLVQERVVNDSLAGDAGAEGGAH